MYYKLIANQIGYVTEAEAYEHLAKGIVIQAIEDYRKVLHGNTINRYGKLKKDKKELEKFFKSQWFHFLCDWDGVTLMKIIQEQERTNEINESTI